MSKKKKTRAIIDASPATVEAMYDRARRVFSECLLLLKQAKHLELAGHTEQADIVTDPLSLAAELIGSDLHRPTSYDHLSDVADIHAMLWHAGDSTLNVVRTALEAAIRSGSERRIDPMPAPTPREQMLADGRDLAASRSDIAPKVVRRRKTVHS